ncbi:MAG: HAMP domain-containing protein, partial [Hoeflea sp.]
MTIRLTMIAVVSVLAAFAVAATSLVALDSWDDFAGADAVASVNPVTDALLESAGAWALERGVTNAALSDAGPASQQTLARIREYRELGNGAVTSAMDQLAQDDDAPKALVRAVENAFAASEVARSAAIAALSVPGGERAVQAQQSWVPTMTALIIASQDLRLELAQSANRTDMLVSDLMNLRHFAWMMSEYAGRERALLGGAIAGGHPLDGSRLQTLATYRGFVELSWDMVQNLTDNAGMPEEVRVAAAAVGSGFIDDFQAVRAPLYEAGISGNSYPLDEGEWILKSTAAINRILALQDAATKGIGDSVGDATATSLVALAAAVLALLLVLAVCASAFWIVSRRLARPLDAMTKAMRTLAAGEHDIAIPGVGRSDEIGDMAGAVQVFKENAIERDRLESESEASNAARERRNQRIATLIERFESASTEMVDAVGAAATELQATAQAMTATAEETDSQASAVAAAAEQASANVQTVSAATEELTSSVQEIARQVSESQQIADRAVTEAERTDDTVKSLSEAAGRIGDVVRMITD